MSSTTRTLAWVAVLGMLLGAALNGLLVSRTSHGSGVHGVASPSVVDSSAVVRVRDSLGQILSTERRRADSLQACMDTCPDSVVVLTLTKLVPVAVPTPGVPADTVRVGSDLLRAAVDSLASCHVQRDSLTGAVTLWQTRDAAHAEAYRIAQERPVVVGDTSPPSRATWAAVGAAGALVGVTAILLLAR